MHHGPAEHLLPLHAHIPVERGTRAVIGPAAADGDQIVALPVTAQHGGPQGAGFVGATGAENDGTGAVAEERVGARVTRVEER